MSIPRATSDEGFRAPLPVESPPGGGGGPAKPAAEHASLALLGLLRRHVGLIALCAIVVAGGAYVFSSRSADVYSSTASLLFRQSALGEQLTGFSAEAEQFNTVEQEAATNVALVSAKAIAEQTASRLGPGYDVRDIQDQISVAAREQTRVVDVTAFAGDPADAARIANTYMRTFIESRVREQQRVLSQALTRLEAGLKAMAPSARSSQPGIDLRDRISTLRILEAVQSPERGADPAGGRAAVPGRAAPEARRRTGPAVRHAARLRAGRAARAERSHDPQRRGPRDGVARAVAGNRPASPGAVGPKAPMDVPPEVLEAFRLIHANLRYSPMRTDCLVVSSASAGEGKTTCSWHLAVAAASTGASTLLIEADLRRRSLAKRYPVSPAPGLSSVLTNQSTLADAAQVVPVAQRASGGEDILLHLDVLTAGPAVPNPGICWTPRRCTRC